MKIHLKRNEKLFLNGAVICLDRRGSIELLNDAQFLLQNHIMQQEDAKSPLQQLYFIVQTMLMDPPNAHLIDYLFQAFIARLESTVTDGNYLACLKETGAMVEKADYYGALKILRHAFHLDGLLKHGRVDLTPENKCEAA